MELRQEQERRLKLGRVAAAQYLTLARNAERDNQFVVFDAARASLLRVGVDTATIYRQNNRNLEPRAGIAWGATTVVVRCSVLSTAPPAQTLQYQLVIACVCLLAGAVWTGQTQVHWTPAVWVSLAFHGIIVSFASFLAWFWMLRTYLASRLGVFSFMTPLFGMLFGAWLLGEPIEAGFLVGAIPVLLGIVLVSAGPWLGQVLLGRGRSAAGL